MKALKQIKETKMSIKQELLDRREATKEEIATISNLEHKDIIDNIAAERLEGRDIAYILTLRDVQKGRDTRMNNERRYKNAREMYKASRERVLYGDDTLLDLAYYKGQTEVFAEVHALLEAEESNR